MSFLKRCLWQRKKVHYLIYSHSESLLGEDRMVVLWNEKEVWGVGTERNKQGKSEPYIKKCLCSTVETGMYLSHTQQGKAERRYETQLFNRITHRNISSKASALWPFTPGSWVSTESLLQSECSSCQVEGPVILLSLQYGQQRESLLT